MSLRRAWRAFLLAVVLFTVAVLLFLVGCVLGAEMTGLSAAARGAVFLAIGEVALLAFVVQAVRTSLYGSERAKFMLGMPASPARVVRSLSTADTGDLMVVFLAGAIAAFGAGLKIAGPSAAALAALVAAALHSVALCYGATALALLLGPARGWAAGSARTLAGLVVAAFIISATAVGEWRWIVDVVAGSGAARWFLDHSPWHAPWAALATTLSGEAAALPWGLLAAGVVGLPLLVRVLAPWRVRRMRMEADPPAAPRPRAVRAAQDLPGDPRARRAFLLYGVRLEGLGARTVRASLWLAALTLALLNVLAFASWRVPPAVMSTLMGWALVTALVVLHHVEVELVGEEAMTARVKIAWFDIHAHALSSWLPIGHLETPLVAGLARAISTAPLVLASLPLCAVLAHLERGPGHLIAGASLGVMYMLTVLFIGVADGARAAIRPIRNGRLRALPALAQNVLLALPVLAALAVHGLCAPFSGGRLVSTSVLAFLAVYMPMCLAVVAVRDRIRTLDVDLPRGREAL